MGELYTYQNERCNDKKKLKFKFIHGLDTYDIRNISSTPLNMSERENTRGKHCLQPIEQRSYRKEHFSQWTFLMRMKTGAKWG